MKDKNNFYAGVVIAVIIYLIKPLRRTFEAFMAMIFGLVSLVAGGITNIFIADTGKKFTFDIKDRFEEAENKEETEDE